MTEKLVIIDEVQGDHALANLPEMKKSVARLRASLQKVRETCGYVSDESKAKKLYGGRENPLI